MPAGPKVESFAGNSDQVSGPVSQYSIRTLDGSFYLVTIAQWKHPAATAADAVAVVVQGRNSLVAVSHLVVSDVSALTGRWPGGEYTYQDPRHGLNGHVRQFFVGDVFVSASWNGHAGPQEANFLDSFEPNP